MLRDIAVAMMFSLLHRPYKWGGNDPMEGYDCSGFVIEVLKSVGILPRKGDWTADGLSEMWPEATEIKPGCLVFYDWDGDGKIDDVQMIAHVLDNGSVLTIGAKGGGPNVVTEQDAKAKNAYIKMRPWLDEHTSVTDPFVEKKA